MPRVKLDMMLKWTFGTLLLILPCMLFSGVQGSTKKGIIHIGQDYVCGDFDVMNNMSWWYDYTPNLNRFRDFDTQLSCSTPIDNYIEADTHVSMIWGLNWGIPNISQPGEFVMGFNEPTHESQANLTPVEAVEAWPAVVNNSNGKTLVCPSAAPCGGSNCITNNPEDWLDPFFENCTPDDCCSYLAIHSYVCDPATVLKKLDQMYNLYNRPIWLTEFACSGDIHPWIMLLFMKLMLPKLEEKDNVYRYSWYKARQAAAESGSAYVTDAVSLLQPDAASLTELGEFYNNYQGGAVTLPDIENYDFGEENTTLQQLIGVFKEEAMLVLEGYTVRPCDWWRVLNPMVWSFEQLPMSAQAFYLTTEKPDRKTHIRGFFDILMCATQQEINDTEIWDHVVRIKALPVTGTKGLNVPSCT